MNKEMDYSCIVPVFNEEEVLVKTYQRLTDVMQSLDGTYEIIFVNDGSKDLTRSILQKLSTEDNCVKALHFSRNFGHQIAITAGANYASGKAVIVIDADLQDPPELIVQMVKKWKEGYQVVYAKRLKRKGESFFKKQSASLFYRILSKLTDINIPVDTGDFRLMDAQVCRELASLHEKNPFVRGQVSWLGFKQTAIHYERDERAAGETKYPLKKMIKLSIDGITSFSYRPLKLASYLGVLTAFIGFVYLIIVLFQRFFTDTTLTGWTSIIILQLVFGGTILFILGLIGEYIGRIYDEVKDRPLYIVEEENGFSK
ncbi:glycosyltransferase family 2 protein [Listeria ivanovii]|uniref:Putative sugar transferase n=1 Tax=Listeria ivanovii (strain ATCC BAA-678 / PAM 55) TaxID=881621 RepID=G2ZDT6_LISIP|nr:glycosyltransferase family 2 protein [Listeria ivanovii]AHI55431.1 glycosyltransferase [Listeria ivanovii WSLC3009]AIS64888.1 glycosyltransferase [Listeria ivanovii subsp. ivanovii]MBC1758398.1 glycosyltransferase family 2 protein [Listeria ivanovii]MBK3913274.1 glycosyltransferase family 2 protein [Listeria ivanovii subsp. ivanovii]MBK3920609.1 glycosyltransferase family 2 protein [Listeria ivanovii subsp. ivanovii]